MPMTERTYDLVVAGAGVGGVAAALAGARAGLRVALVEKQALCGGLATSGLVNVYLPLCDGRGRQVTFGIAEELLWLSARYGPGDPSPEWRSPESHERFRVIFSPAAFVLALDEVLEDAGVEVWLDTLLCAARVEGDRIVGVEVENADGRGLMRAKCFVDATGDAVVAHRAGAACRESGNWLSVWAFQISAAETEEAVARALGTPVLTQVRFGGGGAGPLAPPDGGYFAGRAEDVTRFLLDGRREVRKHYRRLRQKGLDRNDVFPIRLPTMPQFRTTRCIVGRDTVRDGMANRPVENPVGMVGEWRRSGEVWEIPYGALVPERLRGLLAVGRCVAAEDDAWHATRVIPTAALTGEIAGVAAALAIQSGVTPDAVPVSALQEELTRRGFVLRVGDLGTGA